MHSLYLFLVEVKTWIWGIPLLILLIGTGIYLTFLLKGMQFRYLVYAFKQVVAHQKKNSKGDISPFQALMTSLAGAIGTGSIVGMAAAISIGGLGSLFWMWITAFISMATKYAESLLAVKYREVDHRGEMIGGPMEYMEKGLGWKGIAVIFALLGSIAAICTGNLVQANAIAEAVHNVWDIHPLVSGIITALLTALVIIGGVKSIGNVAGIFVPFMALFYIGGGVIILFLHADKIPLALWTIITSAFEGQAAFGGFAGAGVLLAIQTGAARSIFTNEAGLGIPSMAAAAAKTDSPGRQAMITMTGALISTVIVCTITGLVLAVTSVQGRYCESGELLCGASMAIEAFSSTLAGGKYIVTIGLILFAFSTVIAWAYYGEKCCEYLLGEKYVVWYRVLFALLVIPGAVLNKELPWELADIANGLMAVPNLIALIALSKVIKKETTNFLLQVEEEEKNSG